MAQPTTRSYPVNRLPPSSPLYGAVDRAISLARQLDGLRLPWRSLEVNEDQLGLASVRRIGERLEIGLIAGCFDVLAALPGAEVVMGGRHASVDLSRGVRLFCITDPYDWPIAAPTPAPAEAA